MTRLRAASTHLATCLSALVLGAGAVVAVGCGSTDGSEFDDDSGFKDDRNADGGLGDGGGGGAAALFGACAQGVGSARLAPANLVFVYDRSGSMGDNQFEQNRSKRWDPVAKGMESFLKDPLSQTLNASLEFYPYGGSIPEACAWPYHEPDVPLQSLANPQAFLDKIAATNPEGGTPTKPALEGGVRYAKEVLASRPGEKAVVVLVTDGYPSFFDPDQNKVVDGCQDNNVAGVAQAASGAHAEGIDTWVIGVGPGLENLQQIAQAGGTNNLFTVSVDAPDATTKAFQDALTAIRQKSVACHFDIPPPPEGKVFDKSLVNVVIKDGAGQQVVVKQSPGCEVADAWQYDDAANPKKILLCPEACTKAQASEDSVVNIAFGCETQNVVR